MVSSSRSVEAIGLVRVKANGPPVSVLMPL